MSASTAAAQAFDRGSPFGLGSMLLGIAIIVGFSGAFAAWSLLAPLESAVVAPGVVSVDTNTKTVQHLEGGIVEEILVRDGNTVAAGDVLIRLENTLPVSVLNEIQGQYFEALATEARLVAERDDVAEIRFPDELRRKVADEAVRDAIMGQESIFTSRRQLRNEQQNILERTIAGLEAQIAGFQGQIEAANRQISLIEDELRDALTLREQGLMIKPRLLELQRQKAELEGNASSHLASIGTARQSIEQARLKLAETRANEVSVGAQELRAVRALAYELEQKLAAAADVMNRTEIRSPIAGTVTGLKVHTVGGVVAAGEPLLDIVPLNEKLVIQTSVDQLDIDQIKVGLPATIWLWALNRRDRAALEGSIETISADRLVDSNTGSAYYLARVVLDTDSPEFRTTTLQPGMSADVMIRTGERTVWNYLMAPISSGIARAMREE